MRFHSPFWTEALKVFLKLVVMAPLVLAFLVQLHNYRFPKPNLPELRLNASGREQSRLVAVPPGMPDHTTIILVATFGAATCAGATSLLFQFTRRRYERITSVIFFGVVGLLMVVNVVSELISSGLRADMRVDYLLMLGLFSVSACGVWLESCSQNRFYETKIG